MVGARREVRSRYRRDRWGWPESAVAALGAAPAALLIWAEAHAWPGVVMAQSPLAWPEAPLVLVVVVLLPGLAAVVSPVPPRLAAVRAAARASRRPTPAPAPAPPARQVTS
jgi:energy-coupling factor transport system permease protein